jgi:hypothetical protein
VGDQAASGNCWMVLGAAGLNKLPKSGPERATELGSGSGETFNRLRALAYSSRNLSNQPGPPHLPWKIS